MDLIPIDKRDAIWLFANFSEADIPKGSKLSSIELGDGEKIHCDGILSYITQQFAKPFEVVPLGWKTLVGVKFSTEVPMSLKTLPSLDSWYDPGAVKGVYLLFKVDKLG